MTTPAAFSIVVFIPDVTPPVVTPNVVGTAGSTGWYLTASSLTWSVSDPQSAVTTTGCGSATVSAESGQSTFTCTATSSGGTTTSSVTVGTDSVAPQVSVSVTPQIASTGWWNAQTGAPTISFTCTDATSGIASCPTDITVPEAMGVDYFADATDLAGNVTSAGVASLFVDLQPPTVWFDGGPEEGVSYQIGMVPAASDCIAFDETSGIASCDQTGYDTDLGPHTVTLTATDNAGNTNSVSRTYWVYGIN